MDPSTSVLAIAIASLLVVLIFFVCLKQYWLVLSLLIATTWMSNISVLRERDIWPQEEGLVRPGSYLRVALLMMLGCVGAITFLREYFRDVTPVPLHLKLLGVFVLVSLLSITYSIDPYYIFIRWIQFLSLFAVLLGLKWLLSTKFMRSS